MLSKRTTRSKSTHPVLAVPTSHHPDTKKSLSEKKSAVNTSDRVKNTIEQFDDRYDDSSDEEDVKHELNVYDVNKNWKQAQEKLKLNSRQSLINDDLLSFTAHVAASRYLHSEQVGKLYYPLKKKILGGNWGESSASVQLRERTNKAIIQSLDEALESVRQFLKISAQKQLSVVDIEKIFTTVQNEFKTSINAMNVDALPIHIEWLKVDKLCFREKSLEKPRVNSQLCALEKELSAKLLQIFARKFNLAQNNQDRNIVKAAINKQSEEVLADISVKYALNKKMHTKGRDEAVQLLAEYSGNYRHSAHKIRDMIESSPANGKVETMLYHKLEERGQREELCRAYLDDLIALNADKGKMSAQEAETFKQYFTLSNASLSGELADNFAIFLKNNLQNALRSFHRPTLGDNYQFVSSNPCSFYANLRLSNRSQKRQILNKKYAFFKNDSVARSWKLNDASHSAVVETQELSHATLGRRDYVQGLSNYEKIYEDIAQVKSDLKTRQINIDDKMITEWLRTVFQGGHLNIGCNHISEAARRSIEDMIVRVSYLIHGCEGSRNIAMIVIIPMMLDLILESDEWTLEEAFTGRRNGIPVDSAARLMPMSPEGAVAAARTLERFYRPYTPHPYLYPGVEDREGNDNKMSKDQLVKFEARVVRAWIIMKSSANIKYNADRIAEQLLEIIASHFSRWFDQDLVKVNHAVIK